jgi:hypothetical protein
MPSCVKDRVVDVHAAMKLVKSMAEALFLELGLKPGDSIDVEGYRITVPACGKRLSPFIVPVDGIEAAA